MNKDQTRDLVDSFPFSFFLFFFFPVQVPCRGCGENGEKKRTEEEEYKKKKDGGYEEDGKSGQAPL